MAEHTTAGKAFVARIVHQLVPTIEQDFWRDDPHKGDVIQHLCFFTQNRHPIGVTPVKSVCNAVIVSVARR